MALRLLLSLLLLGVAFYFAGIGDATQRAKIAEMLQSASPIYLAISYVLTIVLNAISTVKWKMLLNEQGYYQPFKDLFAIYYVGKFYNTLLPTSIGGDAMRAVLLGKRIQSMYQSAASIAAERIYGMITLLIFAGCLFVFVPLLLPIPLTPIAKRLLGIGALVLALTFLIMPRVKSLPFNTTFNKFSEKVSRLMNHIRLYSGKTCAIIGISWSLLFYLICIVMVIITTLAFNGSFGDWRIFILITPIILLMINIPISYAGIGILELAYTLVFDWAGLGGELGLSVALFIRFKSLLDALIGGLIQHRYV